MDPQIDPDDETRLIYSLSITLLQTHNIVLNQGINTQDKEWQKLSLPTTRIRRGGLQVYPGLKIFRQKIGFKDKTF